MQCIQAHAHTHAHTPHPKHDAQVCHEVSLRRDEPVKLRGLRVHPISKRTHESKQRQPVPTMRLGRPAPRDVRIEQLREPDKRDAKCNDTQKRTPSAK